MKIMSFDINFAVSVKSFYMLESFRNNGDIYKYLCIKSASDEVEKNGFVTH